MTAWERVVALLSSMGLLSLFGLLLCTGGSPPQLDPAEVHRRAPVRASAWVFPLEKLAPKDPREAQRYWRELARKAEPGTPQWYQAWIRGFQALKAGGMHKGMVRGLFDNFEQVILGLRNREVLIARMQWDEEQELRAPPADGTPPPVFTPPGFSSRFGAGKYEAEFLAMAEWLRGR